MAASGNEQARISGLAFTPVKGTRLQQTSELKLDRAGMPENRRFFVIDARDRMVNGKQLGSLQAVVARFDLASRRLALEFPDGRMVEGEARPGAEVRARFFSRERAATLIEGPWSTALSDHLEQPVRLVEASRDGTAVDRGVKASVSLISCASLERLAEVAEQRDVDGRRFRMLVEVDGVGAHEEDAWVGRVVGLGAVRVRVHGHVGRCLVTSRAPETGEIDLPTLDYLSFYRLQAETTEPLAFGIYGEVLSGGTVRVGDPLTVES